MGKGDSNRLALKDYPDILTVADTAGILGLCNATVYKLIKEGKIPAMKVGSSFRIVKSNLLAYLKANQSAT